MRSSCFVEAPVPQIVKKIVQVPEDQTVENVVQPQVEQIVQAMLHDGFPPEWLLCKSKEGKVFYICLESMEYYWQHPLDIMNSEQMKP